jgi:hypothetical protein
VVTQEEEDVPVPIELLFDKCKEPFVDDLADVAREDEVGGCLSEPEGVV